MIVYTMTDQEILKELGQELKNDLIMRLKRWGEKSYPECKLEKLALEKFAKIRSRGAKAISLEGSNYIQIALDPITYKTKFGNIFIIISIIYLNMKLEAAYRRDEYLLKVPGRYKYLPEKGKNSVTRGGYQYFSVGFDYDYDKDGNSKYRKPRIQFIKITSHFLDRLLQRSSICEEIVNMQGIGTIHALSLLDDGIIPFSYTKEEIYDYISQLSDEEIEEIIPKEDQLEAFSVKYDVVFIEFFDGCIVCTPGIENRRIITLKTFLTKEQAKEYQEEMKLTAAHRISVVQRMIENECYY